MTRMSYLCTLPDCDTTNNFLHMQYKQHPSVTTLANTLNMMKVCTDNVGCS